MNTARILVIEDDTRCAPSLAKLPKSKGYAVTRCHRDDEVSERTTSEESALVITTFRCYGPI
jgi:DNA-binding response OmpR family regulator